MSKNDNRIILAIDVGSSSIRCSAYHTQGTLQKANNDTSIIPNCSHSRPYRSVVPNTGRISLFEVVVGDDDDDDDGTENDGREVKRFGLLDMIDDCVDETLTSVRSHYYNCSSSPEKAVGFQIVGVGITTFVMNLIGVDEGGIPLGTDATMSYACGNDERVMEECKLIQKTVSSETLNDLHQRTGAPLHSSYALPQLRAFYKKVDETKEMNVVMWQSLVSVVLARWRGRQESGGGGKISYSEASWTGMFNFRRGCWDEEVLKLLPSKCRSSLPTISDYDDCGGGILQYMYSSSEDTSNKRQNPYWDRWPELRDTKLFLGIGDGACATIGSKCTHPTRICVTIGTSAAARVCLPLPLQVPLQVPVQDHQERDQATQLLIPRGLFCYRIDASTIVVGGALTDGGSVVEWISDLFRLGSAGDENFEDCMRKAHLLYEEDIRTHHDTKDHQKQLSVVPFLSGERSTHFRIGATGCISGLTRNTQSHDIMKSSLEGVILRLNAILHSINQLRDNDDVTGTIIVASGAALERNVLWRRMLADSSGRTVVTDSQITEGTSRGAAMIISSFLSSSSISARGEEPLVVSDKTIPTEGAFLVWARARLLQDQLIDALEPLWASP